MKTIYVKPEICINEIELSQMVCVSGTPHLKASDPADLTTEQEDGGYMLSRNAFWEDDDIE